MKKNPYKSEYFSLIIYDIETNILDVDKYSSSDLNYTLKDTDVKSAIRKALTTLKGANLSIKEDTPRDQAIGRLASALTGLGKHGEQEDQVPLKDYLRALLVVEDSLKTRREMYGHARGYLDFVRRFLEKGETI